MKLDPDIPIVQNEAAIMTTMAAELFLKSLAKVGYHFLAGLTNLNKSPCDSIQYLV
jgi:hypothetical protein